MSTSGLDRRSAVTRRDSWCCRIVALRRSDIKALSCMASKDSHRIRKLDNRPLEMSTVDGDIKLEYRDDFGRVSCPAKPPKAHKAHKALASLAEVQTPKEAFRSISWKFHGKARARQLPFLRLKLEAARRFGLDLTTVWLISRNVREGSRPKEYGTATSSSGKRDEIDIWIESMCSQVSATRSFTFPC